MSAERPAERPAEGPAERRDDGPGTAPAAPRARRPDESMTLLVEMMNRPLDPSYAAEARRRREAGLPPSRTAPWRVALVAALIGLLLVTAGRALRQPREAVARQKSALVEQIESRRHAADVLAQQRAQLSADIAAARSRVLGAQDRADLAARLSAQEVLAGTVAVTGPGIELTVDDAPRAAGGGSGSDPRAKGDRDMGTVVSRDLQLVVNGLWTAGAEAVSINGQRLTSTSAIRFAGDAILVDYRPLARPYVVTAIGDGARLGDAFAHTEGGVYLQDLADSYGIVYERRVATSLTCPPGSPGQLRYVRMPAGTPTTPPGPSDPPSPSSPSSPTGTERTP